MQAQAYSPRSIHSAVRTAGRFVDWLKDQDRVLDYAATDRFIAHRASAGGLRNGEPRALNRLRDALTEAGVFPAPARPADAADDLLALYASDLRRRGYRDKLIASHLWFCAPFLRALWREPMGI